MAMVDTARWGFPAEMSRAGARQGEIADFEAWFGEAGQRLRSFTREKPEQAVLWALGIGFVLGWKLKPW